MLVERFRAFAHRGGAGEAPENSLAAFRRAAMLGFIDMETDVRGTRDGVAVVHHDATLDRTTDRSGQIAELAWTDVRRASIHGQQPIMRLEDLLSELPDCRFTVDVKDAPSVPAVIRAIHRVGALDRVTVGSFSHRRLTQIRAALPVSTSASPGEVAAALVATRWRRPWRLHARYLQVPPRLGRWAVVDHALVEAAHQQGIEVHVWTIDDADTMGQLIDMGVDGIMTDRPEVLRSVLTGRGLW